MKLQHTVIKTSHSLGHLGMTKTKQMLRQKHWFPQMNKMVEHIGATNVQLQQRNIDMSHLN